MRYIFNFRIICLSYFLIYFLFIAQTCLALSFSITPNQTHIVSGFYNNGSQFLPLLAQSFNAGNNWSYPSSILSELPSPHTAASFKRGASCNQNRIKTVCIVNGVFNNGVANRPLLGVALTGGSQWSYPAEIYQSARGQLPSAFVSGNLNGGASCSGNVCIATGAYINGFTAYPLLALSKDAGQTWVYPRDIYDPANSKLPLHLQEGELEGYANCKSTPNRTICIATGLFRIGQTIPLLALTNDSGNTWSYPSDIYAPSKLPALFRSGELEGTSCNSDVNTRCIATGLYSDGRHSFPLLALTQDGGLSWSYPIAIYDPAQGQLPSPITSGFLGGANCSGSDANTVCIASGFYNNGSNTYPLLALSTDGGNHWSYPSDIFNPANGKLPSPFANGSFLGTPACVGDTCIAAGSYTETNSSTVEYPLLAISRDNGATWTYPRVIHEPALGALPVDFHSGRLLSGVSCTGSGPTGICTSAGFYNNGSKQLPLLALSTDSGAHWSFPTDIYDSNKLPNPFATNGALMGNAGSN